MYKSILFVTNPTYLILFFLRSVVNFYSFKIVESNGMRKIRIYNRRLTWNFEFTSRDWLPREPRVINKLCEEQNTMC